MVTTPDLKLLALDGDDLTVLSAHLQDAVSKVADMAYQRRAHRFVAIVNRFDWVAAAAGQQQGKAKPRLIRRQSALRIERVLSASVQGIDLSDKPRVLSMLALSFEPATDADDPGGTLTMLFAGGAAVRLELECIECALEDLGPAWRARTKPNHGGDGGPGGGKAPR